MLSTMDIENPFEIDSVLEKIESYDPDFEEIVIEFLYKLYETFQTCRKEKSKVFDDKKISRLSSNLYLKLFENFKTVFEHTKLDLHTLDYLLEKFQEYEIDDVFEADFDEKCNYIIDLQAELSLEEMNVDDPTDIQLIRGDLRDIDELDEIPNTIAKNYLIVKLIRLILHLEEKITFSKLDTEDCIREYKQLQRAYRIVKNSEAAKYYRDLVEAIRVKIEEGLITADSIAAEQPNDYQQEIETFIDNNWLFGVDEITKQIDGRYNLDSIMTKLDRKFIANTYVKSILEMVVQEFTSISQKLAFDTARLLPFLDEIFDLMSIEKITKILENKMLSGKLKECVMSPVSIKDFCRTLKVVVFEAIAKANRLFKPELDIFNQFLDFIQTIKEFRNFIKSIALQQFLDGKIGFKSVCVNIDNIYDNYVDELKIKIKSQVDEVREEFLLAAHFRKQLRHYIRNLEVRLQTHDKRQIIEVVGFNYSLSEAMVLVIKEKSKAVDEVRFISSTLHIDENLDQDWWHGMNVAVCVNTLKLSNSVVWNVSGNNSVTYINKIKTAGKTLNGMGRDGCDGFAGESGGNVSIIASKIDNPDRLTIISNGGSGCDGQDGENGEDGKHGATIPNEYLYKIFNRKRLLQISRGLLDIPHLEWNQHLEITGCSKYKKGCTKAGVSVELSYYSPPFSKQKEWFILFRGGIGQVGKKGGYGGLGGYGGFGGEIYTSGFDINHTETVPGKIGNDGNDGISGKAGSNGGDKAVAIADSIFENWKHIYGLDEKTKISLEPSNENTSPALKRIWYSLLSCYIEVKESFLIDPETSLEGSESKSKFTAEGLSRSDRCAAKRKFAISRLNILQQYEKVLLDPNMEIVMLVENVKLAEIRDTDLRQLLKIRKPSQEFFPSWTFSSSEQFVEYIEKNPQNKNIWRKIGEHLCDLTDDWGWDDSMKDNFFVEKILIEHYRRAWISQLSRLEISNTVIVSQLMHNYYDIRFWTQYNIKQYKGSIQHEKLGYLTSYFLSDNENLRENVCLLCKDIFAQNSTELDQVLRDFIAACRTASPNPESELDGIAYTKSFMLSVETDGNSADLESNNSVLENVDVPSLRMEFLNHLKVFGPNSSIYMGTLAILFSCSISMNCETIHGTIRTLFGFKNDSEREVLLLLTAQKEFRVIEYNRTKFIRNINYKKTQNLIFNQLMLMSMILTGKDRIDEFFTASSHQKMFGESSYFRFVKGLEGSSSDKLSKYFSRKSEMLQITQLLEKCNVLVYNMNYVLHEIEIRFRQEGCLMDFETFKTLLEILLEAPRVKKIPDQSDLIDIETIVTGYPQKQWVEMLVIRDIEQYFVEQYGLMIEEPDICTDLKMADIHNLLSFRAKVIRTDNSINSEELLKILKYLCGIHHEVCELMNLKLQHWPALLEEHIFETFFGCFVSTTRIDNKNLKTTMYYATQLKNNYRYDLALNLVIVLGDLISAKKTSVLEISNFLYRFCTDDWILLNSVVELVKSTKDLGTVTEFMERKYSTLDDGQRSLELILAMTIENEKTSVILVKEDLLVIINTARSESTISNFFKFVGGTTPSIYKFSLSSVKDWTASVQQSVQIENFNNLNMKKILTEYLAVFSQTVYLTRGYRLRDVQKLVIATLILNGDSKNILAEVATGEGKSLIVAGVAIFLSLCAYKFSKTPKLDAKVHIITSSPVLAKRDADAEPPKGYRDLFEAFELRVGHNCYESVHQRTSVYSNCDVVYGDLSIFQRDYLLSQFHNMEILNNQNDVRVVVDEVDSMLLDKGNNILYLSDTIAGLDQLEPIFVYIWMKVNSICQNYNPAFRSADQIVEDIANEVLGKANAAEVLRTMDENLPAELNKEIQRLLSDLQIVDNSGKFVVEQLKIKGHENIKVKLEEIGASRYLSRLLCCLEMQVRRQTQIQVPTYLREFVQVHLKSWVNSAIAAINMAEGTNYVLDVDRTEMGSEVDPNIIIIDVDTGTDLTHSQWDNALHQFIQIKHGCRLSPFSLKAVFISNVSYLMKYKRLYGLTGTLGTLNCRDSLASMYNVNMLSIPTFKTRKFSEMDPVICSNEDDWLKGIMVHAQQILVEKKRAVLIICESIADADKITDSLSASFRIGGDVIQILTYKRDYEEFTFEKDNSAVQVGQIIIATNLAGRGTDLRISEELKRNGGLHVVLTYLPSNQRIEQQAFGRAARCGEPGTGQLNFLNKSTDDNQSSIIFLKKSRDVEEHFRVLELQEYYINQILAEEKYLEEFRKVYSHLKNLLDTKMVKEAYKKILLEVILNRWALWLDQHRHSVINRKPSEHAVQEQISFDKFLHDLRFLKCDSVHDYKSWILESPIQATNLGIQVCLKKNYEDAIEFFNLAINGAPNSVEASHYFKAFAMGKLKHPLEHVKQELKISSKLFQRRMRSEIIRGAVVESLYQRTVCCLVQVNAYSNQKKNLVGLYNIYLQSIDDVLGHRVTPESFAVDDSFSEGLAILLIEDLVDARILEGYSLVNLEDEDALSSICLDYGCIQVEDLKRFLSNKKYLGNNFMEEDFCNILRTAIPLPNREDFWKELIELQVLSNERELVLVDLEQLKHVDTPLWDILNKSELEFQHPNEILDANSKSELFLYPELVERVKCNASFKIFRKDFITSVTSTSQCNELIKMRVFTLNDVAGFAGSTGDNLLMVRFTNFDSLTIETIVKSGISKEDAVAIIDELLDRKIINNEGNHGVFRLNVDSRQLQMLSLVTLPVYSQKIRSLLNVNFIYRIAFENLFTKFQAGDNLRIDLISRPHLQLLGDLIANDLVTSIRVNTKADFKLKLEDLRKLYSLRTNRDCYRSKLFDEDVQKRLYDILKLMESSFKGLKIAKWSLKPLDNNFDKFSFGNTREVSLLAKCGLNLVIRLKEKKYTPKMLILSGLLTLTSIAAISFGVIIDALSLGSIAFVKETFIGFGVSGLVFSLQCFCTGYFSYDQFRMTAVKDVIVDVAKYVGLFLAPYGAKILLGLTHKDIGELYTKSVNKKAEFEDIATRSDVNFMKKGVACLGSKALNKINDVLQADRFGKDVDFFLQNLLEYVLLKVGDVVAKCIEGYEFSNELFYQTLSGEETTRYREASFVANIVNKRSNVHVQIIDLMKTVADQLKNGLFNAETELKAMPIARKLKTSIVTIKEHVKWTFEENDLEILEKNLNKFLEKFDKQVQANKLNFDRENLKRAIYYELAKVIEKTSIDFLLKPLQEVYTKKFIQKLKSKLPPLSIMHASDIYLEKFKKIYNTDSILLRNMNDKQKVKSFQAVQIEGNDAVSVSQYCVSDNPQYYQSKLENNKPFPIQNMKAFTFLFSRFLRTKGLKKYCLEIVADQDDGDGVYRRIRTGSPEGIEPLEIRITFTKNEFNVIPAIEMLVGSNSNIYDQLKIKIPTLQFSAEEFRISLAEIARTDIAFRNAIRYAYEHHSAILRLPSLDYIELANQNPGTESIKQGICLGITKEYINLKIDQMMRLVLENFADQVCEKQENEQTVDIELPKKSVQVIGYTDEDKNRTFFSMTGIQFEVIAKIANRFYKFNGKIEVLPFLEIEEAFIHFEFQNETEDNKNVSNTGLKNRYSGDLLFDRTYEVESSQLVGWNGLLKK